MLTYSFSKSSPLSLYEQLYRFIKEDIINLTLAPHTKLPSKRNFAKNLGVSTITVENAYSQLMMEGYIYSMPKKGYFVEAISPSLARADINEAKHEEEARESAPSLFADFTSNQTNEGAFPFSVWAKLMREVISQNKAELMNNPPSGGVKELKDAIRKHLKQFRGIDISAEQIIVGAGTEYLYTLLIQLLGRDKIYALEDPGYKKIARVYESSGASCFFCAMDESGIDVELLEKSGASIAHISPSHHFPSGIIMPINRRYELLAWAQKSEDRYIIEDEYDSEFRFSGKPISPMLSIDSFEKVIYMNTFTKSLSSTVRISYMVLPKHLTSRFYSRLAFYSCTVSNFEQYTLARFINEGYFEKHINRMRNYYKKQRNILLEAIEKSPFSALCSINEEHAGLHFLLNIKSDISEEELLARAMKSSIKVNTLSQYYYDKSLLKSGDERTLIINYSSLPAEKTDEAIALLLKSIFE